VVTVAKALQHAGVTILNSGYGWHEARVPTIVTSVPRARLCQPGRAARRSDDTRGGLEPHQPNEAEDILRRGDADMISMARPSSPMRTSSTRPQGRADEINTCIGCNQACLDHLSNKRASCLVNPRACHERNWCMHRRRKAPRGRGGRRSCRPVGRHGGGRMRP
jgi:2,4-dienoyl-CoA reductase (NADPH2)